MKNFLGVIIVFVFIACTNTKNLQRPMNEKEIFLNSLKVVNNYKKGKKTYIDSLYSSLSFLIKKTGIPGHFDINHTNPYQDKKYLFYDYKQWKEWYRKNKRQLK
jgi:hypothetical protein